MVYCKIKGCGKDWYPNCGNSFHKHVADGQTMKQVYTALCQSVITYCITSWGGAAKSHMILLERAQRLLLKVSIFKPSYFSTRDLYDITGVLTGPRVYNEINKRFDIFSKNKNEVRKIITEWLLDLSYEVIEKYTDNVRFCIICNYLGKIIPALQSRCTRFRFAPLQQSQIVPRLRDIAQAEGVKITDDGLKALMTLSGGDMRKVLNTLQSTWLAHRDVTEDNVYTCVGHPLRSDITTIVNWLLNEGDFATCFKNIQDLKIAKGLALGDILTEVHTVIQRMKLPPEVVISLLIKMSEAEARLASGCSERVELAALIAAFQGARDQVKIDTTDQ